MTETMGKGYGMPSSHAQFVAFFAAYLSLFILIRHNSRDNVHQSSTHVPTPLWQRMLLALSSVVGAAAVARSRIYLNYHTPRQVLAGCAVGAACAVAWFVAISVARHFGLVDTLLDSPPLKFIRMRDLVIHETLEDAGWERWQRSRKRRSEAIAKKAK
jgi:dolichyldiphosphatase